jgi:predicted CopG family antitoxin
MVTKRIRIELDVYERLKSLRTAPAESFSQVLRRELGSPSKWTGGDFLKAIESGEWTGLGITEEGLRLIDAATRADRFPEDPWTKP